MTDTDGGTRGPSGSHAYVPAATIAEQRVAEVRDRPHARGNCSARRTNHLRATHRCLLDLGVIVPRLTELYRWSARELEIPEVADLVRGATPTYAWDPDDREPWSPPPTRPVRATRWLLPL